MLLKKWKQKTIPIFVPDELRKPMILFMIGNLLTVQIIIKFPLNFCLIFSYYGFQLENNLRATLSKFVNF